jgi:hypothetical protein
MLSFITFCFLQAGTTPFSRAGQAAHGLIRSSAFFVFLVVWPFAWSKRLFVLF